jgi:hypothetical protein
MKLRKNFSGGTMNGRMILNDELKKVVEGSGRIQF